ncbi:MAG TPA: ATP-binding cassette domain-containing protein, partial [Oscillospiraceae bacterium]|nr:ATP-binding cassette domain-containing protein [Oscillospiraceae bacterium]
EKLPKRYDEEIMERGSTLSSGQRQLLSFARTIASKPSLLILDEATANIDTETELLIQDAINKMSANRSMIAVAHRISTIANADKIIVMHKGRVAEQGTRDELLERNGLFKVLYKLQYEEF